MPTVPPRLLELLRESPDNPEGTYLDLLGEARQAGPPTGLAQRLMSFGVLSAVYERYWRPTLGRVAKGISGPSMAGEVDLAIDLLRLRPGGIALDVACGTGRFTRAFAEVTGFAIGLDGSRSMLDKAAAEGGKDVVYLRADAVRLPFEPSSVDAVCCFAALHMFAEPEVALDHFASVLKPGGRLALLTSARHSAEPARTLDTMLGAASGQRMFDRGEIGEKLRVRGFTEITERYSGVTQIVAASMPG